jgi:TRAP-type C4-dicarboxylate transport system substrate-binding protein
VSGSTTAQWKLASEQEIASREALEAQAVNIVDLDEAARSAFKQAVRTVIEQGYSGLSQELVRECRKQ